MSKIINLKGNMNNSNIKSFEILPQKRNVTIGLALGSGAIRGLAHIGIIDELLKGGIKINEICGSSIGSIIGCLYAGGMDIAQIKETACEISAEMVFDYRIPFISLFRGKKLKNFITDIFHKKLRIKKLEELNTKVFITVVDILKGIPVILREGPIVDSIMASCAVPLAFPPYKLHGGHYIDGGVLLPVPSSVLKGRGHDVITGINLGFGNLYKKLPCIFHIAGQTIITMGRQLVEMQKNYSDCLITPEFNDIGYWQFKRAAEIIEIGQKSGRLAVHEIIKAAANKKNTKINYEITNKAVNVSQKININV